MEAFWEIARRKSLEILSVNFIRGGPLIMIECALLFCKCKAYRNDKLFSIRILESFCLLIDVTFTWGNLKTLKMTIHIHVTKVNS